MNWIEKAAPLALLVSLILLSHAKGNAEVLNDILPLLDSASDAARGRWYPFLREKQAELECAVWFHFLAVSIGVLLAGVKLPGVDIPEALRNGVTPRPALAIAAFGFAVPSIFRLLAAPRRAMRLREELTRRLRSEANQQADDIRQIAIAKGRDSSLKAGSTDAS